MSFFVRFYCVLVVSSLFSQHLFTVSNTLSCVSSDVKNRNVVARLAPYGCFSETVFDQIITHEQDPYSLYEWSRFLKAGRYDSQTKQDQILSLMEKAAQGGHPEALYETGRLFEAACGGIAEAQYDYALQCLDAENYDTALFWLKEAARSRCLPPAFSFNLKKRMFVSSPRCCCFESAVSKLEKVVLEQKEKRFKENLAKAHNGNVISQYYVIPDLVTKGQVSNALTFFEKAELAILMHLLCLKNVENAKSIDLDSFKQYTRDLGVYEIIDQLVKNGNKKARHLLAVSHYSWAMVDALFGESKISKLETSISFLEQIISKKTKKNKKGGKKKKGRGVTMEKLNNRSVSDMQIVSAAYCFLGKEYDEKDDIKELTRCLTKALEYCPENICALSGLGNIYLNQAEKAKNKKLFKKGFALLKKAADLGDIEACCFVGSCYFRPYLFTWGGMSQERNGKQVEQYLKTAANNGHGKSLRLLCHYYDEKGEHETALKLFEKVFDGSAGDLFDRGIYYLGVKKQKEALRDLQEAKEKGNVRAAVKLAQVYLSLGNLSVEERCHNALSALIYALNNGAVNDDGTFFSAGIERTFEAAIIEFASASQKNGNEKIMRLLQCLLKLLENKGACKFVDISLEEIPKQG